MEAALFYGVIALALFYVTRGFLASLSSGVPFVAFHESDAAAGRVGSGLRRYATDAVRPLVRRRVCLHVVVSDALHATLALPAEADWLKLYNPVSEKLWTAVPLGIGARDFDALFVGRLVADKGITVLRDALLFLQRPDRLRVAIAGSSDDRSHWEGAFREVVGEVTFVGPVGGDRLRDLCARSRIVVMPSLVMVGMGMVAAEALSNGTPICARDQPALREVVGEAGLFHAIGDAAGLAENISRLLDDPGLWKEKCERARPAGVLLYEAVPRKPAGAVGQTRRSGVTTSTLLAPRATNNCSPEDGDDEVRG